jgi:hypothetical protein
MSSLRASAHQMSAQRWAVRSTRATSRPEYPSPDRNRVDGRVAAARPFPTIRKEAP